MAHVPASMPILFLYSMKNKNYISPEVEIIVVSVEQGFNGSNGGFELPEWGEI